jgi:Asp-tRNA(Asn)/Glu-tRNA(Gln) amidotransferase A subunit family amidase
MWKGLCGMDVDLLKAIWNGVEMDVDPYVDPHVDFVAWIPTLPTLNVPGFQGENGLPIGLTVIGPRYYDLHVLHAGKAIGEIFASEGGFVSKIK